MSEKVHVIFNEQYSGLDFTRDGIAEKYVKGQTIEVDAAFAKRLIHEMGADCPFEIVEIVRKKK